MSTNLIIEASHCCIETPKADPDKHQRLREVRESMLPAEGAARAELDANIAQLARWERGEEKGRRLGLSILSPEIFAWKKNNLPAFAVFSVQGEGECVLSSDPSKEKVPACCHELYQNALKAPVSQQLQKLFSQRFLTIWCVSALLVEGFYFYAAQATASATWGQFALGLALGILSSFCASLMFLIVLIAGWTLLVRETERTATARFTGVIPYSVKQKIKQYESEFQEIIVVSEAEWSLTEKRVFKMPASCDPLIVGWDGDFFWLIDRFDTSSIEQLAADEFAVRADSLGAAALGHA